MTNARNIRSTTPGRRTLFTAFALVAILLLASVVTADGTAETAEPKLYMDVHKLGPGNVTLEAVMEAHAKDLEIQDDFGVDYQHYWVDEDEGVVYCLVSAPSAEAAEEVHRQAHGLVADEIHEVEAGH